MAALGDQGGQVLSVGVVAVEVEIRIYPEVVVAIDDHRIGRVASEFDVVWRNINPMRPTAGKSFQKSGVKPDPRRIVS
tara:strand:+ start:185 stop:418 length:234 start_codon:yes stop_codon:yes gene_type:complete